MGVPSLQSASIRSDEDLVALSSSAKVLYEFYGSGRKVVKVSDSMVMKFGLGVREEEADIQRLARELADPTIVRIPLVYRFFTRETEGFLLM